jgi:hypothetical protein
MATRKTAPPKARPRSPSQSSESPTKPDGRLQRQRHQLQADRVSKTALFTLTPEEHEKLDRVHEATGTPKSRIVGACIMAIREGGS